MSFLAPWVLAVAGAAALGTVALHLIALARPPAAPFPTARFIPDTAARAASRTSRPTDRWLLLLRVLAILSLGIAFARPVRTPERASLRQIILVDRSRAVAPGAVLDAVRDSALARLHAADAVIVFDTAAVVLDAAGPDSLRARLERLDAADAPARLSAALVAASRLAATLRDSTDSVRVVLVSPLAREAMDAATLAVRGRWPAAIEVVRTPRAEGGDTAAPAPVTVRAPADDPLAIAIALAGAEARSPVRVVRAVRDGATPADSAWARDSAGLLLVWADGAPAGWTPRATPDTVGALVAAGARDDGATLVAPLLRVADAPAGGAVRARWADGAPAAVERPLGEGCVREVVAPLAGTGDLALRESFARFVDAMLAPCGGERDLAPAPDSVVAALRGTGGAVAALGPPSGEGASLAAWPLALGLALLLGELAVRRGSAREGA